MNSIAYDILLASMDEPYDAEVDALIRLAADEALALKPTPKVVKKDSAGRLLIWEKTTKTWIVVEEDLERARKALRLFNKDMTKALREGLMSLFGLKAGSQNPFWPEWKPITKKDIDAVVARGYPPPPAMSWNFELNPVPNKHPIATYFSLNGLKKYVTHVEQKAQRNDKKFTNFKLLEAVIPKIKAQYLRDMKRPTLDELRVRACVLYLLDIHGIRIGEERHLKKDTRGACTMQVEDVLKNTPTTTVLHYVGKAAKANKFAVEQKDFSHTVSELLKVKRNNLDDDVKTRLFIYRKSNGTWNRMMGRNVNGWMKSLGLGTAKDFRFYFGTMSMVDYLRKAPTPTSAKEAEKIIKQGYEYVAQLLVNTPDIARDAYVHPAVVEAWRHGFGFGTKVPGVESAPTEKPPKRRVEVTDVIVSKPPKRKVELDDEVVISKDSVKPTKRKINPSGIIRGSSLAVDTEEYNLLQDKEKEFFKIIREMEQIFRHLGLDPDKDFGDTVQT